MWVPEAGQAAVSVARPGLKRSSPDYYAGLVANAALGNGFVSRLNREIRIKRGLSYGARSSLIVAASQAELEDLVAQGQPLLPAINGYLDATGDAEHAVVYGDLAQAVLEAESELAKREADTSGMCLIGQSA